MLHAGKAAQPDGQQARSAQVMQQAARAVGHSSATRLLFLENSPACHGTPTHAILADSQHLPAGHRCMLLDLRRLCVPPYAQYFVLPAPAIVDLPWVRCVLKKNFPRLPRFFAAYLDETLLDRPCALQTFVPLVTLIPLYQSDTGGAASACPVLLDTCSELLEREGYQALFHTHTAVLPRHFGPVAPTTETTTGMLPCAATVSDIPFGALIDPLTNIQSAPLEIFAASARARFVSCTIRGNVVEGLLSFVTAQLGEVHETFDADMYSVVPQVFFGPEGRPTVFLQHLILPLPMLCGLTHDPFSRSQFSLCFMRQS